MKWRIYKLLVKLRNTTALDSRALSLFRIGIGVLLIADLLIRISDLDAFYTDAGLVPRSLVWNTFWNPGYIPIHTFSGERSYILMLFICSFICALFLVLGWKTRLFTFLSWLLLISLQNRNPYILQGGDELLRLSLFWGMFLPLGRHYSLDTLKKGRARAKRIKGLAPTGYVLLIFSVYFFSALQKNSAEWQTEGSAIYYALSLDQMVLPAGKLIYPYPGLLKFLTHLVFGIELLAGFFLFFPGSKFRLRTIAVIVLVLLHVAIGFTLYVGLFFIIGIITLIPLLSDRSMHRMDTWFTFIGQMLKGKSILKAQSPKTLSNETLQWLRSFALGTVIAFCCPFFAYQLPMQLSFLLRYYALIKIGECLPLRFLKTMGGMFTKE
jgi:Vitamin K-dependent gamma-carboxylase